MNFQLFHRLHRQPRFLPPHRPRHPFGESVVVLSKRKCNSSTISCYLAMIPKTWWMLPKQLNSTEFSLDNQSFPQMTRRIYDRRQNLDRIECVSTFHRKTMMPVIMDRQEIHVCIGWMMMTKNRTRRWTQWQSNGWQKYRGGRIDDDDNEMNYARKRMERWWR